MLLPSILVAILLILIVKWVLPILKRHSQLQKDYQNISPLSLSPIPFAGNLHHFDKETHIFYKQVLQWAKQCQEEDKGIFCIWYTVVPIIFICSAKGLEVMILYLLMEFHFFPYSRLSATVNNWLNRMIIDCYNHGLKLVCLQGKFH